jgi:hypothetical protein
MQLVVLADPPREGLVLPSLAETSPLTDADAAACYEAMLKDAIVTGDRSGADLLVNYRPDDLLPDGSERDASAEDAVRSIVVDALGSTDGVRIEPQVGSTKSARVGNTVTHLLREEDHSSVVVLSPTAPFVARTTVDNAAMKLRRSPVVLGPAGGGRTYYRGFTELVDFEDAFEPPELLTVTNRADDADLDVDFLEMMPLVETGDDLATAVAMLRARVQAGRIVPGHFAEFVADQGLDVTVADGAARVLRV